MREDEVEWVREAFASGRAAILRLVTDHSTHDCGKAAGITVGAWWRFENGESLGEEAGVDTTTVVATDDRSASLLKSAGGSIQRTKGDWPYNAGARLLGAGADVHVRRRPVRDQRSRPLRRQPGYAEGPHTDGLDPSGRQAGRLTVR